MRYTQFNFQHQMTALDSSFSSSAHVAIASHFNKTNIASWPVNAFLICSITTQPLYASLSDCVGRRIIFVSCAALFMAGIMFSITAPSWVFLILARCICGLAASGLMVMGIAPNMALKRPSLAVFLRVLTIQRFCGVDRYCWREKTRVLSIYKLCQLWHRFCVCFAPPRRFQLKVENTYHALHHSFHCSLGSVAGGAIVETFGWRSLYMVKNPEPLFGIHLKSNLMHISDSITFLRHGTHHGLPVYTI